MKLNECIEPLFNYEKLGDGNPDIMDITMDSRAVQTGSLFVCIEGENHDGHMFATAAVSAGASAIVAEKVIDVSIPVIYVPDSRRALSIVSDQLYHHPSGDLNLIGVTGTNGKTTVSHLVKSILESGGDKSGLIGTMGVKYGEHHMPIPRTTPESDQLHRMFRDMINEGVRHTVMEVSSHALVQGRVRGCDYNIAVFTNLTQDHLDYHATMKDYMYAKSLLFSQLGNTYNNSNRKAAVLNRDDETSQTLQAVTSAPVFTYGIDHSADFTAENIAIHAAGTTFDLVAFGERYTIKTSLLGKFSVYNILAASLACYLSGMTLTAIISAIQQLEGIDGRFENVNVGQDFNVIVDYSHTADSLKNALQTIKEFAKGRIISVVGCGGDRDRDKRPVMARTAVEYSDWVVFTSDNPRSEDPEAIIHDMESGVGTGTYTSVVDRRRAIFHAINQAQPDDVILIAGKGHETYQVIRDQTINFDDRRVAAEAIKERQNHEH
ncbi:UDP-N-acetylmuramoyl-L-alanyl-D-glutamate--2,6-diaminopimelate ligase [Tuberibacillus sp. Marseille-P3662]|uniref:UDP-N-acetylmuramoyl-L-alanyl-D-glutamate--2, 6-diaminopimelate ligase n=1 Tax=Tuberibacillus sp. Marseille-P3662 TaxID=1965358 RepID=UPI000A1CD7E9|nr:UDP-N-acetylmuramoyl-L-alanyl-D-glutamate--2,6-diaminopimelate ligase [Tuberibacillus sp. Marseille-P3662]